MIKLILTGEVFEMRDAVRYMLDVDIGIKAGYTVGFHSKSEREEQMRLLRREMFGMHYKLTVWQVKV
tara:strand:+ start:1382 stop:1582 length:201 start_codon:yes stop_codon:yes gene_type:complete